MRNIERKLIDLQEEWMLLNQYEEKILAPSISFDAPISEDKIQEVREFLETKDDLEMEREIYLLIFNAGMDLEESPEKKTLERFSVW